MKPLKERVSVTLDSDIVAQIKGLAEEDDRSFSQFINKILRDYLRHTQKETD
ncbi:MAG: ribbon-helix-helix protein, CopG family [Clostridia bacterium]|nr:ribbon-helix-helix protein, CopG family [Clostridia bacterium]